MRVDAAVIVGAFENDPAIIGWADAARKTGDNGVMHRVKFGI